MANIAQLGGNIRKCRQDMGLTQRALAERLHVSTQAVSSWEQGATNPDIENLCRLSEALNVSIDQLMAQTSGEEDTCMIAVDGGGTKAELVLFSPSGHIKKAFRLPGTNASSKGVEEVVSVLRRGIDLCLESCQNVSGVFIGNAGSYLAELKRELSALYPNIGIRIESDAVNALMCVEGADAALILGTGSILIRHEGDGYRRLGGWGYRLGDPGSGYNFGKEALRATKAYEDGIHQDPLLYSLVKERLEDGVIRASKMTQAEVAAFARVVFEADKQGDPQAARIIENEMRELALQVNATCPNGGKLVAVGGISEHFGDRLFPVLRTMVHPELQIVTCDLPPVYGASRACLQSFGVTPAADFEKQFTADYTALTNP